MKNKTDRANNKNTISYSGDKNYNDPYIAMTSPFPNKKYGCSYRYKRTNNKISHSLETLNNLKKQGLQLEQNMHQIRK